MVELFYIVLFLLWMVYETIELIVSEVSLIWLSNSINLKH